MKRFLLLPVLFLGLAGCAQKDGFTTTTASASGDQTESTTQKTEEGAVKVAKGAGRFVVSRVAGTPVKVLMAAGTAAGVVEKKTDKDKDGFTTQTDSSANAQGDTTTQTTAVPQSTPH